MRFLSLFLCSFLSLEIFAQELQGIKLEVKENLRTLKNQVLEIITELPAGSILHIPNEGDTVFFDFRNSQGNPQRSTNGFFQNIKLLSAPNLSVDQIKDLNNLPQGLFLTTTAAFSGVDDGSYQARLQTQPGNDYNLLFEASGRPRYSSFTSYFETRFKGRLNLFIDPGTMTSFEIEKWSKIFKELALASNRSEQTPKYYLITDLENAKKASLDYERNGLVASEGAWTIAVKATAVRNGFANVPCAEFVSEMIRQAYERAGYDVFEDFNEKKGNRLIWSQTAAVVNLANALNVAGWVPWELTQYAPPVGALMMHSKATTPGHAYIAAGFDGKLIIDNGSPSGRDLHQTSEKIINLMYRGGVFFLPPGMIPKKWN